MQISITNGTLTQVQETLSPVSGYELPATVTVTGATSVYSDGTLILTNPTSTMSITASAEESQPTTTSNMKLGSDTIEKVYFGSDEVSKIYLGSNVIYEVGGGEAPDNAILDSNGNYIMASDGYLTTTESSVEWTIIDDEQTFTDQQDVDNNNYRITSTGNIQAYSYTFDGMIENNGLLETLHITHFNNTIYLKGNSQTNLINAQIPNEIYNIYVEDNAQLTISGDNTIIVSLDNIIHTSTNNIIINRGTFQQDPRNYNFITIPAECEVNTATMEGKTFYRVVPKPIDIDVGDGLN